MIRILLLIFLSLNFLACSLNQDLSSLESKLQPAEISMPEYETWQMQNGINVSYIRDDELPFVNVTMYFPIGSYHFSTLHERIALNVAGSQMREGGAGNYLPTALDKRLEELSAGISTGFGSEYGTASFRCLKDDLEQVFSLYEKVLKEPRFDSSRLEVWRGKKLESLKRRKDNPGAVSSVTFNQLVYRNSVYGITSTTADIKRISRADLLKMHREFVKPNGAFLVITGDLSKDTAYKLSQKHLANWKVGQNEKRSIVKLEADPQPGVYFIEDDVEQSTIRIGHIGTTRLGPDHYKIDVFNKIFGIGGFGSRLLKRIRVELGLAYSAYGGIGTDIIPAKAIMIMQTKTESTGQAVEESLKVVDQIQKTKISEEELKKEMQSIENSYVFKFENLSSIVSQHTSLKLLGYPDDFYDSYLEKVRETTINDIQRIANQYWDPEQFIILVVGNKEAYNQLVGLTEKSSFVFYKKPVKKVKFDEKAVF